MLLLWVLGGITAVCGALTLAELSAALPKNGRRLRLPLRSLRPVAGVFVGLGFVFHRFCRPSAASAFAFAKYMLAPFGRPGAHTLRSGAGPGDGRDLDFRGDSRLGPAADGQGAGVDHVPEDLCGLGAFALSGLSIGWRNSANLADLTPDRRKLAVTLMSSMVYIYYAYTGWNSASYLAGEIRDPQRRLPQAILLGTAGVTFSTWRSISFTPWRCRPPTFVRSWTIRRTTLGVKRSRLSPSSPRRGCSGLDGRRLCPSPSA